MLTEQARQLAARLEAMSAEVVARRRPLTRAAAAKPEVKLFNPRFEEAFVAGKDYDPDRWVPILVMCWWREGLVCVGAIDS